MNFAPEQYVTGIIHRAISEQMDQYGDQGIKVEGFRPDPRHTHDHRRNITLRHGSEAVSFEIAGSGDQQDHWEVELAISRTTGESSHVVPEAIIEISAESVPAGLTDLITEEVRRLIAGIQYGA